jgi:uncharacterized protein YegP (UPF0339 family)
MAGKFDLKKSASGKYFFSLKAGNGQTILTSEMYESKGGATNGIESVKRNAPDDNRYERKTSAANNEPYFVLKAGNGEPIGRSENYSSTAAMENGIESVKQNAPAAMMEDNSD